MCEVYFSYVPVNYEDYGKMVGASFTSFDHFYPADDRTAIDDENLDAVTDQFIASDVWSDDGQKLLMSIVESRYGDAVLENMKRKKRAHKGNPEFTVNFWELSLAEAFTSLDENRMMRDATKASN